MLEVFHVDIAKVDRDIAYVVIAIHVCCKRVFQIFHLFFRRMLQMCLFRCCICCKCFIWMLHMFCNGFSSFQVLL
jgi:hypothetical protein